MSRRPIVALMVASMLALTLACAIGVQASDMGGQQASLGRRATDKEIAAADITVFPDGSGLPSGRATARAGRRIYIERCAGCHGEKGQGTDDFPALAGGQGSLTSAKPLVTVGSYWPYATTLWDYTRRAMPYTQPGSLTTNEVYAVTAYVLYLNGIVAENIVLDQTTLSSIRMPNRDGFVPDGRIGTRSLRLQPIVKKSPTVR
jgi:S-disulfanyl-L-cysteine oxidoreductase SoxD